MNRILSFLIFMVVALSVYFLMHFFVYRTVVRFIPFLPRVKSLIKYFFLFSGLSFPLSMMLSRVFGFHHLNFYAYVWLGVLSISFAVLIPARILNYVFPRISFQITLLSLVLIGLLSVYAVFNGIRIPAVKTITLPLNQLPAESSGFKIVQLSDLHLDSYKSPRMMSRVAEKVNSLNPDLIVITGDFIDGRIEHDQDVCLSLKKLRATHGIISITGNHEYYAGISYFLEISRKLKFTVLRNERKLIGNHLQVIGIEDNEAKRFSGAGPDLETPLKNCDPTKPIIVLRHRPEGFAKAVERGVDLQISGHTHDGQIPPMTFLVRLFLKYPFGLYRMNNAYIYTSCGTGYWGPPMRLFSRAEIVEFVLVSN
jgi:predicted MPP superfamily phosphohydrolase